MKTETDEKWPYNLCFNDMSIVIFNIININKSNIILH